MKNFSNNFISKTFFHKNKLKKLFFALVTCSFFLAGCPYNSKFSLTDSSASEIDTNLTGLWEQIKDTEEKGITTLDINNFNDREYLTETMNMEKGKMEFEKHRAFSSLINGQRIINVEDLNSEKKFCFCKYSIKNDTLKVSWVSDEFVKEEFNNRAELFNFFAKHLNDAKFFEDEFFYKRRN